MAASRIVEVTFEWKVRESDSLWINYGFVTFRTSYIGRVKYMCPRCGECWAIGNNRKPDAPWLFMSSVCNDCGQGIFIRDRVAPGTPFNYGLHEWPEGILRREFLRIMCDLFPPNNAHLTTGA